MDSGFYHAVSYLIIGVLIVLGIGFFEISIWLCIKLIEWGEWRKHVNPPSREEHRDLARAQTPSLDPALISALTDLAPGAYNGGIDMRTGLTIFSAVETGLIPESTPELLASAESAVVRFRCTCGHVHHTWRCVHEDMCRSNGCDCLQCQCDYCNTTRFSPATIVDNPT